MNEDQKKWIEALPKYKKGKGNLEKNGKWCCLGVLGHAVLGIEKDKLNNECTLTDLHCRPSWMSQVEEQALALLNDNWRAKNELRRHLEIRWYGPSAGEPWIPKIEDLPCKGKYASTFDSVIEAIKIMYEDG